MPTTYAIPNGSTAFAATTYTGTGSALTLSNAVNGTSFQPDLVWLKSRSTVENHFLFDSVRGSAPNYKRLSSNLTDAEATPGIAMLTAINSNGITLGTNGGVNTNAATFVGWQWKANGAAVTNTAGSITSQVSANTAAGFSVVTYTGNGTNPGATIGHGLGVAPSFIITKSRSGSGEWPSYHAAVGVTNTIYLNATYASSTYLNRFSAVSASTFTTGSNGIELNTNGVTYVAYCFAAVPGYSAFGRYTGNGSADGPFVYLGFRPRCIMMKRTDSTGDWWMYDTSRSASNTASLVLYANSNAAEISDSNVDILSNGFKLRSATFQPNTSGGNFVYAAFAENPFAYANAR